MPNEEAEDTRPPTGEKLFDAVRRSLRLSSPSSTPWIEDVIAQQQRRGQADHARQLMLDVFDEYRANYDLSEPRFAPWIERKIVELERRGEHVESWKLCRDTFAAYQQRKDRAVPSDLILLPKLLHIHTVSRQPQEGRPLLDYVPRSEKSQLISNPHLPADYELIITRSLDSSIQVNGADVAKDETGN